MSAVEFIYRIALPTVLALSLLEAAVMHWRRPGSYDFKALGVSVFDLIARFFVRLIPLSIAAPFFDLAWEHRLIETVDLSTPLMIVLLFFGQEFCYYWFHRASHRIRWFWTTHSVHHSPNQLNLSAAYRLGLTGRITGTALFFVPLVWIGIPREVVITTLALNLLYQFWIHATWIPRLGWLEYVINTPSSHRVHHASNLEYLDANYGGVLIIFDRLFGTYRAERPEVPCVYGLVKPVTTYNPLVVEFGPWAALFRDLRSARSLREALGYLFMPPGWRPDGRSETTEDLRARARAMQATSSAGSAGAATLDRAHAAARRSEI